MTSLPVLITWRIFAPGGRARKTPEIVAGSTP
jgi:hypothetical protein